MGQMLLTSISLFKSLIGLAIFAKQSFAQITSTEAPCGRTQNYTFCMTRPPNQRQGCMMGLRSGELTDRAYCQGRIVTWEDLVPSSPGLGLPTHRSPFDFELLWQPPPSQTAALLYSSYNIETLCSALGGRKLGFELCHYDPNNTVPARPALFRESDRIQSEEATTIATTTIGMSSSTTGYTPTYATSTPTSATTVGTTPSVTTTGTPILTTTTTPTTNGVLCRCTRKEYRMLTADERTRYHNALLQLKQGYGSYEYDRIAFLHSDSSKMPGAHGGPTFICWHREYLKRLEIALRAVDPTVCLPFWDSSLDWRLQNPADSILHSELLMGSPDSNNYIKNGFLANWITARGDPIIRTLGTDGWGGELFRLPNRDYIINTNQSYNIFSLSYDPSDTQCSGQNYDNLLESNHDGVHVWVGGHMSMLETAPMDPIFFMHHCFMDYIWEQWRLKWQSREQREKQFPPYEQIDYCMGGNQMYQLNSTMVPFLDPETPKWICLSNNYTDFLYTYAPSPSCKSAGGCESDFLFCDTTNQSYPFGPTCCSKIKPGGDCLKFIGNSEQPCFNSSCDSNSGTCVQPKPMAWQQFRIRIDGNGNGNVNGHGNGNGNRNGNGQGNGHGNGNGNGNRNGNGQGNGNGNGNGNGHGKGKGRGPTTPSPTLSPPKFRLCYDNHECCPIWASNGTCGRAKISMNNLCPASCRYDGCQPYPLTFFPGCLDIHLQCLRWSLLDLLPGYGHGHTGNQFKFTLICAKVEFSAHGQSESGQSDSGHSDSGQSDRKPIKQKPPKQIPMKECERNAHFMARNCARTCKKCGEANRERCATLTPVDFVDGEESYY
ncbi:hypothetical protein niasHS_008334 [Heterodera schachtii]|uniref:ShKT domain-containing protein n=1 Tax=Heterodera schachtii TaxID=97005 RepID=A0ABD2J1I9_HETSC